MKYLRSGLLACLCLFFAPAGLAQTLTYQGQLTNTNGEAVNASYGVVFTLYDAASGGTSLWTESTMGLRL